jgi:quercetin dioxygenase-like cupin family protein
MRAIYAVAAATLFAGQALAQGQTFTWGPAPAVFPAGAKMAVLQGDPGKNEPFTVRLDLPAGYRIAAHWHPSDEMITVIKGTFLLGMGDKLDAKTAQVLPAGAFGMVDAKMHHYALTRGHTIVQVHAVGPFQLIYVNPADDPSKRTATK